MIILFVIAFVLRNMNGFKCVDRIIGNFKIKRIWQDIYVLRNCSNNKY